ncbi:hypothetical protein LTR27_007370 [Elasticomyces elasticus]|nr:hypothetical protein LTR27_007370 [Elasticomyces elasticus]
MQAGLSTAFPVNVATTHAPAPASAAVFNDYDLILAALSRSGHIEEDDGPGVQDRWCPPDEPEEYVEQNMATQASVNSDGNGRDEDGENA